MSDDPSTPTHDDSDPTPRGIASSDYGGWLDEAINSLIADVAERAAGLAADRLAVPVRGTSGT
jgi:hypothetical protein